MTKDFSIFGVRSDLLGDIIMSLPVLTLLEKKYPNSYKYFHVLGKCSQITPLLINHPLIDKIKISKNLESYDEQDYQIMNKCNLVINTRPQHKIDNWYNYFNCVEETAQMASFKLDEFYSLLNEEERKPKLEKWFRVGLFDHNSIGYCKDDNLKTNYVPNIAIKPFSGYGNLFSKRSPSVSWWSAMVDKLLKYGFLVRHYGFTNEPVLSSHDNYKMYTHLNYFDQVKAALSSDCVIGVDCGFMWSVGAYSHKAMHLLTFWLPNHKQNELAMAPTNNNCINLFNKNSCDDISTYEVLEKLLFLINQRL